MEWRSEFPEGYIEKIIASSEPLQALLNLAETQDYDEVIQKIRDGFIQEVHYDSEGMAHYENHIPRVIFNNKGQEIQIDNRELAEAVAFRSSGRESVADIVLRLLAKERVKAEKELEDSEDESLDFEDEEDFDIADMKTQFEIATDLLTAKQREKFQARVDEYHAKQSEGVRSESENNSQAEGNPSQSE